MTQGRLRRGAAKLADHIARDARQRMRVRTAVFTRPLFLEPPVVCMDIGRAPAEARERPRIEISDAEKAFRTDAKLLIIRGVLEPGIGGVQPVEKFRIVRVE